MDTKIILLSIVTALIIIEILLTIKEQLNKLAKNKEEKLIISKEPVTVIIKDKVVEHFNEDREVYSVWLELEDSQEQYMIESEHLYKCYGIYDKITVYEKVTYDKATGRIIEKTYEAIE